MYAAYVKGRWLMGFTVLPGSDTYNMLSATEATEQNIEAMKDYIARTCKPFVNAVTDEELRNFFESRDFGGSVLRPKTLVVGETAQFLRYWRVVIWLIRLSVSLQASGLRW